MADVVGYSRLMAEDEAATVRTLTSYRHEISGLVGDHRGRVVDVAGDSLLAEFRTALDAVECAVEIQRVLKARNAGLSEDRRMEFRIGVHLGDVMAEDERIYGDGVNIAARLQTLADPGGVCVSGNVYDLVHGKLGVGFDDLGTQSVKNLPDPVRVYRVEVGGDGVDERRLGRRPAVLLGALMLLLLAVGGLVVWSLGRNGARDESATVPGFGGRPAIAVLPFDNLSRDPEQEYFADGIAEDLITRLSRRTMAPVIARNSSFTYKGRPVDVKQVGQELGARYVVEGSVRRVEDRVRISAQLIDATTGHHLWAETYNREFRDLFALQDQITEDIRNSIGLQLYRAEVARAASRQPENLNAWEAAMRANWHFNRFTKEDNAIARGLWQRAIELDPQWIWPYQAVTVSHFWDVLNQWTESPTDSVTEALRTAHSAMDLDDQDPWAQLALGLAYSLTGEGSKAIAAFELAVRLSPDSTTALGFLGAFLAWSRPDEAIVQLERLMELSPRDVYMSLHLASIGQAYFAAKRYEKAVFFARKSIQLGPDEAGPHRLLAASLAQLARTSEAQTALQEASRLQPDFNTAEANRFVAGVAADPEVVDRWLDALRKAGLEE
jgi:adenylate cyclase